jgi:transmembrane sensor
MLNTTESQPSEAIQAAANWHVVMHSGEVTSTEKRAFKQWHQQAENADAYDKFTDIWTRFEPALAGPARSVIGQTLAKNKSTKGRVNKALASCFILAGLSAYLVNHTFVGKALLADHYVLSSQLNTITLSDNSQIQLSPFSAVNISYSDNIRYIDLLSGRVMIDVAKDASRPLIIRSKQGSARALGTQFSVSDLGRYGRVSVYESSVEVCALSPNHDKVNNNGQCQQLSAGQSSIITIDKVAPPQAANPAWHINLRQQTLVVDDQPLLKVLNELKGHHLGYVKINDKALQHINVSGVFPLNDVNHALTVLSASLPIKVSRFSPLFIHIDKAATKK